MRPLVSSSSTAAPSTAAASAPTRTDSGPPVVARGDGGSTLSTDSRTLGNIGACDLYHTCGVMPDTEMHDLLHRISGVSPGGARPDGQGQQAQDVARRWRPGRRRRPEHGDAGGGAVVVDVAALGLGGGGRHGRRPPAGV